MISRLRFKERPFYGWVVVVVFFIISITLWGIHLSFGVFFKSIESEFSLTRTATSAILSTNMVLVGVFAIFGGWAVDKYGPRIIVLLMGILTGLSLLLTSQANSLWQLFITYSLLLAMGTGALYPVEVSTISRWFDKKRGLALGLAGSGGGLGTAIFAPFAAYLIANFEWRMAYIVIGIVAWLIVASSFSLLKKDPFEIGALPDGVKTPPKDKRKEEGDIELTDLSLLQAIRTRNFWYVILVWTFFSSSSFLVFTHLVPHITDIGISTMEAASVLSVIGGTSIAGRVLMGAVSDRIGRKVTAIICALLQVGAMIWLIWAQNLWMFYLFALGYGFSFGSFDSIVSALIGDIFGLSKIGVILGVLEVGFGIGAAIGPAIGGFIFDVTGSYYLSFLIWAVVMGVVALLIGLIRQETIIHSGVA